MMTTISTPNAPAAIGPYSQAKVCLLYTSDAADELDGVDLGGRRIIKKKFFQAEDGIRDQPRSRGLGDVYKRQGLNRPAPSLILFSSKSLLIMKFITFIPLLLYLSLIHI